MQVTGGEPIFALRMMPGAATEQYIPRMATKRPSGSPQTRERRRNEKAERAARRRRNRIIQAGVAGAIVVAAIVMLTAMANRREQVVQDLSEIGNGVPAVVQVWDITCPICNDLRAHVERIDQDYSDDELLIRVADMRAEEAVRFAARYTDQRRQTLLFLDGNGELVDITTGLIEVESLRTLFDAHAGR